MPEDMTLDAALLEELLGEELLGEEALPEELLPEDDVPEEPQWYVVHTYSGYENKVKANIEKTIENRNMGDQILQVVVPVQETAEIKNGQKKLIQRRIYPGYVMLKMLMNDDTWYVVRNTRGVTSFVGPGSKPVPLSDKEVMAMGIEAPLVEELDIALGDTVRVISGPFLDSTGTVKEINPHKHAIVVKIMVFGRETPVELDFMQVQRL
jgi:transcriptional antiterminator NusG